MPSVPSLAVRPSVHEMASWPCLLRGRLAVIGVAITQFEKPRGVGPDNGGLAFAALSGLMRDIIASRKAEFAMGLVLKVALPFSCLLTVGI